MAHPAAPRPNVSTLSKSEGPLYSRGSKLRRSPPSLQPTQHKDTRVRLMLQQSHCVSHTAVYHTTARALQHLLSSNAELPLHYIQQRVASLFHGQLSLQAWPALLTNFNRQCYCYCCVRVQAVTSHIKVTVLLCRKKARPTRPAGRTPHCSRPPGHEGQVNCSTLTTAQATGPLRPIGFPGCCCAVCSATQSCFSAQQQARMCGLRPSASL